MVINVGFDLETALSEAARGHGLASEVLAVNILSERILGPAAPPQPCDDWERGLLAAARDCGVSLPDSAFSSDALYE